MSELDDLGLSRGPRSLAKADGLAAFFVVAVALVLVIAAICGGWTRNVWIAVVTALVGTAALTALPAVLATTLRRPYEIWGQFRGSPVYLFGTYNREQFGQVSRALIRAQETRAAGGDWAP